MVKLDLWTYSASLVKQQYINLMAKNPLISFFLSTLCAACSPNIGNSSTDFSTIPVYQTPLTTLSEDNQQKQTKPVTPISIPNSTLAQVVDTIPNDPDGERFKQIIEKAIAIKLHEKPIDEIIQTIAHQLLGTSYQAGLLDQTPNETLIASLTKFDCVLFIETVLALVRGIAVQDYTYSNFTTNIEDQRYRQGKMGSYCDRLHYFSEWIADNEKRGNLVN